MSNGPALKFHDVDELTNARKPLPARRHPHAEPVELTEHKASSVDASALFPEVNIKSRDRLVPISVRLTQQQIEDIETFCEDQPYKPSELIRAMVTQGLARLQSTAHATHTK